MNGVRIVTYQLHIDVIKPLSIRVGRLGVCEFAAGQYIYTGSARRNLEQRITRHLATSKRLHWHIDYLLATAGVKIVDVRRFAETECEVNQRTPGDILAGGFGASDCRAGCGSHLKYLGGTLPELSQIVEGA